MASLALQKLKKAHQQGKNDNQSIHKSILRNINALDSDEKQLEDEIRKAASEGDKATCISLAQQLARIRSIKSRNYRFTSHLNIVQKKQTASLHAAEYGMSLDLAAKNMKNFNKAMNKTKVVEQLQQFDKEQIQMDMSEESLDSCLPSLYESDDATIDERVQSILNDPRGHISNEWPSVPSTPLGDPSFNSEYPRNNVC
uniref:Clone ZZD1103 mRNA sequence n=1 Tax=Schistosoma japonicum TaxID=6182 RepID=Q86F53_SCHJA|nr:similar to GenBank Accession Number AF151842 CGI-84 protein in Homo sapiens [Schistosoma japonicum]